MYESNPAGCTNCSGASKKQEKTAFIDSIKKKWILREIGSGTREIFINKIGAISEDLDIFMQLQDFEEIKTIMSPLHNHLILILQFLGCNFLIIFLIFI
ncbi:hypothetical protein [Aliarcobacter cibarius]|uniref:hypothetical protein n=1 Tax=Aliarcobacter cibarius TaxID=255507 RepID=UPI001D19773B|nr:hypothetical protein [Aliarcobacter cibarius]